MCRLSAALLAVLLSLSLVGEATAQWSASPGDNVINGFGPGKGLSTPVCRGACGMDCPASCDAAVRFECVGNGKLLRIKTYDCGTHQACRQHDDCLDRCSQEHGQGYDCQTECHAEVVSTWGLEQAGSWAMGGGPFDGSIHYEYSMDTPGGPQANYVCPEGSKLQCGVGKGGCLSAGGSVEPVFASFNGSGAVNVSSFRSGRVCTKGGQPSFVCQAAVDIQVSGDDSCAQSGGAQPCTWYGFELDYQNANPAEPLICQSTGSGEGDFLGNILGNVIKSAPAPEAGSNSEDMDDLGKLLGEIQNGLQSGKSMDQVFGGITMTTADGQTFGGASSEEVFPQPGVPGEVTLNGASGHLLVPMFELGSAFPPGTSVERQVRCLQQGRPVIETTFRLHGSGAR